MSATQPACRMYFEDCNARGLPREQSMHITPALLSAATLAIAAGAAAAQPTFLAQERVIAATTPADENTVTAAAADFSPFVTIVSANTPFPTPSGVPAPNQGET